MASQERCCCTNAVARANATPAVALDLLASGRAALSEGRWERARELFERARALEESGEAVEGLAIVALWRSEVEVASKTSERAFHLYRERGDRRGAARMAIWLAFQAANFKGEGAVASGWLHRARSLLHEIETGPEHGWLWVREASFVLGSDAEHARELSSAACELGCALGDSDLEMQALALEGLALVSLGQVEQGMRRLDEATAAAVGGEMGDILAIAFSCCYLIFACERVRDFDRAGQWCGRVSELCERWGLNSVFALCRAHYGSVLTWQGQWERAEAEFQLAMETLGDVRHRPVAEALARLGELRRRQGLLREAGELFASAGAQSIASLGLAELALERGDAAGAVDHAQRVLRLVPGERRTERAAALELLVRAHAKQGQLDRGQGALGELEAIADAVGTDPLRASASEARGMLARARKHHDDARRAFGDAVVLFERSGAPYDTARARTELAEVLLALDRAGDAEEECRLALEAFGGLGAHGEAKRARALLNRSAGRGARAPGEPSSRELEVLRLVADGLGNADIAARLVISEHTVHRHLANIFRKLSVSSRAAAVGEAARRGML